MKRIIVCVKPVPDPKHWEKVTMDPVSKTLNREGIPTIINPLDKHALEAALLLREAMGTEVVLLTMAPPFSTSIIREALAMGADRSILLADKAFAGSDTLASARILSAGIKKLGSFDLIFCGNSSVDGSTAQVPSQLAEILNIPSVTNVSGLQLNEGCRFLITQKIEQGKVRIEAEPPILLSFTKEANTPRYTPFMGIIEAEEKEITVWSNTDLGLDQCSMGLYGSPTKMVDILLREKKRKGKRVQGSPEEMARVLADKIYQIGVI